MLTRSAHGRCWMGRYLERTQHLCRLLRLQTEAAAAAWTVPSGKVIWLSRSHTGMDQPPPGSRLELHSGADVALVDDFTFEHCKPRSAWVPLRAGA